MTARGFSVRGKVFSAFIAVRVAVLGLGLAPSAAAAETISVIRPVRQCGELVNDFDVPGAATHVTAATVVRVSAGEPEHCDVRGYVEPAVQFQLKLPTATFTGRYLQYGCGGFCGMISATPFPDCGVPHGGDLAVAVTNDGHVGALPAVDGAWANNQATRNDWFYRGLHVLSLAAKWIIATYYGSPPKHSYFSGCSNGAVKRCCWASATRTTSMALSLARRRSTWARCWVCTRLGSPERTLPRMVRPSSPA